MTDDEKFVAEFEAGRWPLAQWHHRDHIKLAYLYLKKYPLEQAVARVSAGIKAHNAARGVAEGPRQGYHETMTQAWMRLVHFTLSEYGPEETADAFYEHSPHLSQKNALRYFYSPEAFIAPRSKYEFVEPDLTPFPRSQKVFTPETT